MLVQTHDLWFVVDGDDLRSLPHVAYTTQGEAEQAAAKLTKDTAELRARLMPNAPVPAARQFDDVWRMVRDNWSSL